MVIGTWVGLRDGVIAVKRKLPCLCRESNPDYPVAWSLYRVSYHGSVVYGNMINFCDKEYSWISIAQSVKQLYDLDDRDQISSKSRDVCLYHLVQWVQSRSLKPITNLCSVLRLLRLRSYYHKFTYNYTQCIGKTANLLCYILRPQKEVAWIHPPPPHLLRHVTLSPLPVA
jgi:hypothetical protein